MMATPSDAFRDLRVNLGLILNGDVATLRAVLRELEGRPGVRVVYVRTSGSHLRVVEEGART
jgi:hypothetical protein